MSRAKGKDILTVILLIILTLLYAKKYINFNIAPVEDAAMLMRYAEHLSEGHGIVWNIGDRPVDGATDFLFMIVVALFVKIGFTVEYSVRLIGFTAHILIILVVYIALRKLHRSGTFPALISSSYLAVGPGLYYVAAYFGTPFFALFGCITWCIALAIIKKGSSNKLLSFLFSISSLITGLIRPEGVILAGLMLLAIVYHIGLKRSRIIIISFFGVFAVIGGAYFIWRWNYFGYPLPNPFYKKGGGNLYFNSLKRSIENVVTLALPFLPAYLLGFRSPKTTHLTIAYLIPVAGFTSVFVLLSNEMNFGRRFQYVLLPIILVSWYPLVRDLLVDFKLPSWRELGLQKRAVLVLLIMLFSVGAVVYQVKKGAAPYFQDGRYSIAQMLSTYRDKTIATTEAGLLPLYSHWQAIDTWGLNDQWIAHNGGVTSQYLAQHKPHIIMFHGYFSPLVPPNPNRTGDWSEMVMTLKDYAETNDYILAGVFGYTPYDTHYYYVRPDFTESKEITELIKTMDYHWYGNGQIAINYALIGPTVGAMKPRNLQRVQKH